MTYTQLLAQQLARIVTNHHIQQLRERLESIKTEMKCDEMLKKDEEEERRCKGKASSSSLK
jgi:hypothetical protein